MPHRRTRALRSITSAVAVAALGLGCTGPWPAPHDAHDPRVASGDEAAAGAVLRFAAWIRGASADQLREARDRLEREAAAGASGSSLLRLALLLHEPRVPGADPDRARELVARFLDGPPGVAPEDARALAAVLLDSWRAQAALARVGEAAEERARRQRDALAAERERRTLAEERLEALIDVERRVVPGHGPGAQVKPASR